MIPSQFEVLSASSWRPTCDVADPAALRTAILVSTLLSLLLWALIGLLVTIV